MPDSDCAGQRGDHIGGGKVIAHQPHAPLLVKAVDRIMGDDAARLLTAVLQRVQAEGYKVGRVGDVHHAKDATFLPQFIIVKRMGGGHVMGQGGQLRIRGCELPLS